MGSKAPPIPKITEHINNRAQVTEAMKHIVYQKSYYADHYKSALDKLNKAKNGTLLYVSYSEIKKVFVIFFDSGI
jgi:hypothetical protein